MVSRVTAWVFVLVGLVAGATPCVCGLSPNNVAVVVNQLSAESERIGRYYCYEAGIPISNFIEIQTDYVHESVSSSLYAALAAQIRDKLVHQIGVDPNDPAHDPNEGQAQYLQFPHYTFALWSQPLLPDRIFPWII